MRVILLSTIALLALSQSPEFVMSATPAIIPSATLISTICEINVQQIIPSLFLIEHQNGTCNNFEDPSMGQNAGAFSRLTNSAYCPDLNGETSGAVMSGCDRPNPRLICNMIMAQNESIPDERSLNDFIVYMGQFFTHEQHATGNRSCNPYIPQPINSTCIIEYVTIETAGMGDMAGGPDLFFNRSIPCTRNAYLAGTGTSSSNPRVMTDSTTSWIDGSNVYGPRPELTALIRSYVGGRLKSQLLPAGEFPWYLTHYTSDEQKIFYNMMNPVSKPNENMFVCGDFRCNEMGAIFFGHVIFLREHQYWAGNLSATYPDWNDEQIFQQARRIVRSEIQKFSAYDYFPLITGKPLPPFTGYNYSIDARPTIEMVYAGWKIGHSQQNNDVAKRSFSTGEFVGASLKDTFFKNEYLTKNSDDLETFLYAALSRPAQKVDTKINDALRNFMFGTPMGPHAGIDLVSLNIIRGRDVGQNDYNSIRVALGLTNHTSWDSITSDVAVQHALATVYNLGDIDLWVGGLAEDHMPGAAVGELFQFIFMNHIGRTRDGDRFWFENAATIDPNDPSNDETLRAMVKSTTLRQILLRTTNIQAQFLPPGDRIFFANLDQGLTIDEAAHVIDTPFEEIDGEPAPLDQNMVFGSIYNYTSTNPGASSTGGGTFQAINTTNSRNSSTQLSMSFALTALLMVIGACLANS